MAKKNEAKQILARLRKSEKEGTFPYVPKNESSIKIHSCSFVLSSVLISALPKACQAWSEEAGKTMTWGSANRTLVDRDFYLDMTNDCIGNCQSPSTRKQLETLKDRVLRLPKSVYIDLEN